MGGTRRIGEARRHVNAFSQDTSVTDLVRTAIWAPEKLFDSR